MMEDVAFVIWTVVSLAAAFGMVWLSCQNSFPWDDDDKKD